LKFNEEKQKLNKHLVQQRLKKSLRVRIMTLAVFLFVPILAVLLIIFLSASMHWMLWVFSGFVGFLVAVVAVSSGWNLLRAYLVVANGRFSIQKDTFLRYEGETILKWPPRSVAAVFNFTMIEGKNSYCLRYHFSKYGKVDTCYRGLSYVSEGMEVYLIVLDDGTDAVIAPFFDARFYELVE
jgi:hypothetical protein